MQLSETEVQNCNSAVVFKKREKIWYLIAAFTNLFLMHYSSIIRSAATPPLTFCNTK